MADPMPAMLRRRGARAAGLALLLALTACSGSGEPDASTPTATTSLGSATSPETSQAPSPPPRAKPATEPDVKACYRLTYDDAVAPTPDAKAVPCSKRHSAETFFVGRLANLVDGHLLAVDSERVQDRVARSCPAKLGAAVGGTPDDLRLSMLRAVWFTPTVVQSDAGADWYRCDVVVLDGADDLGSVTGSLRRVLATPRGREDYGMCGTASPDDADFRRVRCNADHTWRAFSVIDLPAGRYPGPKQISAAASEPCQQAAREIAPDPLDYTWGFEGPGQESWNAGQTFIRCWTGE